jgi:3-oxosteroid 1-dehydrogenase
LRRQDVLTNGASLIGQMLRIALDRKIPIWTEAPVEELVVEDGRVVGVRVRKDGKTVAVQATKGVLVAAGGFAHNNDMRHEFGGEQQLPGDVHWTIANPGDTGEVIRQAMALGAATDLMDEAWWLPSTPGAFQASTLSSARQRPGTIFVDAAGKRFVNESNSYMEVGRAMFARDKTAKAVPCWLILDDGYRRRYAHTKSPRVGKWPKELVESGNLKQGATIEELAGVCGIDPRGLADTIEHFNANAAQGRDPDYGRGVSAYNRNLGDPGYKPNPCLGPLDKAPYYAIQVVPGDIGTCGGLLTDEHAHVLDKQGSQIPGLYATGNSTATVMGRHYLGAGASIANSMVFGYLAALDATKASR